MCQIPKYSIELLAPARDKEVAIEALRHGADAVYMGASSHGARAAAGNPVSDIASVADYAHRFGARVYVTVNTLIYDHELHQVERLIRELYRAEADALIVQDLGVLRLDIPPIALHASTQCDIRTPATARFLQDLGFSQLVLPRELTADEIRAIRQAVTVPIEAFVHGALCVSYSGDCYASQLHTGRSANRGECAQLCRLPYDLTDGAGRTLATGKHLLSLRDLNRLADLHELIDTGVSSLKIEGRLKDAGYVKNVVAAYDRELKRLGVQRSSRGQVETDFTPDPARSFNRGFTSYFFHTPAPRTMASVHTPKSIGTPIAAVDSVKGKRITLRNVSSPLANGDGLIFFDPSGHVGGFRVNRVDSPTMVTTADEPPRTLSTGTTLYRNFDKVFADKLSRPSATRTMPLHMTLRRAGSQLCLDAGDVSATIDAPTPQKANSPQADARRRVLSKLGGSDYRLEGLTDLLADEFVPASQLTELRRRLTGLLEITSLTTHRFDRRRKELTTAKAPENSLTYHANVANRLAEQVYRDHGVSGPIQPAPEVKAPEGETMVMHTRYCLRRELGHCRRTPAGAEWTEPLTLSAPGLTLHLGFDCATCSMTITMK
ncbi:MAG: U32 family peptidase [Muribaculaceae bacterium]|nr:U32 family peptidase [Muribaculaceae bacterium]